MSNLNPKNGHKNNIQSVSSDLGEFFKLLVDIDREQQLLSFNEEDDDQ